MCKVVGLDVAKLKRVAIGGLKLGMLKPGEYKQLTAQELESIFVNDFSNARTKK